MHISNLPQNRFLLSLIIIAIIAIIWLFLPFLPALFFALLIAISSYSYYEKLSNNLPKTLAAFLMCLMVVIILVLPIFYILLIIGVEVSNASILIQGNFDPNKISSFITDILDKLSVSEAMQIKLLSSFNQNLEPILLEAKNIILLILQNITYFSFEFLLFVGISIFSLFYLYLDGPKILTYLDKLSPLDNKISSILVGRFSQLSIILVTSVFFIAGLQGVIFGLGMLFIDMPALFLGVSMAIASFIPVIGGLLIWLPLSIYLFLEGNLIALVVMVVFGAVLSGGIIDNIIRPWFIIKISKTFGQKSVLNHTLITVLSTLAGIIQFGILGLFIGPIIAAMTISIFDAYLLAKKR